MSRGEEKLLITDCGNEYVFIDFICDVCGRVEPMNHGMCSFESTNTFHICLECSAEAAIKYFSNDLLPSLHAFGGKQYKISCEVFTSGKKNGVSRKKIPTEIREKVLSSGKCVYCDSTENLQVDHIKPVSKGGKDNIENLQPLCKTCNVKKGNKIITLVR